MSAFQADQTVFDIVHATGETTGLLLYGLEGAAPVLCANIYDS